MGEEKFIHLFIAFLKLLKAKRTHPFILLYCSPKSQINGWGKDTTFGYTNNILKFKEHNHFPKSHDNIKCVQNKHNS